MLRNLSPPNADDDVKQVLPQSWITVKSYLEQLYGNSIRSNCLPVRQTLNGIGQLLHFKLNSQKRVYEPLVEKFGNIRVELW